jgi:hypothetical protein
VAIDKKIDYEIQGGVRNYRPSEMVTAPKIAKSSPDTPTAKLAYITPEEEDILIDLNLYGSLKGKPNRGPSGLPSLEGDFGGPGGFGGFQGGGDYSSAETGNSSGFDGTGSGPKLPPGVSPKGSQLAQDIRSSFIAAGGGQRVNPGFFDSRNIVSPIELARATNFNNPFAKQAMRNTRGGGLMGFLSSGGIMGNLIRGLGQKFGLGKTYDQPTYDMSRLSGLPFGGTAAFENLDIRDKYNRTDDGEDEEYDTQIFNFDPTGLDVGELVAEVTKKDINASKMRGFNMMDYSTAIDLGVISPNVTEYEFEQLKQGNITEPGTYTA